MEDEDLLDEDTTMYRSKHNYTTEDTKHLAGTFYRDWVLLMVTQGQRPLTPNPHLIQMYIIFYM